MTRAELLEEARRHDGSCKVIKTPTGPVTCGPDVELGLSVKWTYFMCDEPESFPFEEYGITADPPAGAT